MPRSSFLWPLLVTALVLPMLSGCIVSRMYHDKYGLETANPQAFNRDKAACLEKAYKAFPPKDVNLGNNVYVTPPPAPGEPGYNAQLQREYERVTRENERARDQVLNSLSRYDQARDTVYDACMSEKGWYEIEVEE